MNNKINKNHFELIKREQFENVTSYNRFIKIFNALLMLQELKDKNYMIIAKDGFVVENGMNFYFRFPMGDLPEVGLVYTTQTGNTIHDIYAGDTCSCDGSTVYVDVSSLQLVRECKYLDSKHIMKVKV